jgi:hypothetical protein
MPSLPQLIPNATETIIGALVGILLDRFVEILFKRKNGWKTKAILLLLGILSISFISSFFSSQNDNTPILMQLATIQAEQHELLKIMATSQAGINSGNDLFVPTMTAAAQEYLELQNTRVFLEALLTFEPPTTQSNLTLTPYPRSTPNIGFQTLQPSVPTQQTPTRIPTARSTPLLPTHTPMSFPTNTSAPISPTDIPPQSTPTSIPTSIPSTNTPIPPPPTSTTTPIPLEATSTPIPLEATSTPIPLEATSTPIPLEATDTPIPLPGSGP